MSELDKYLEEIKQYPTLSSEEEKKLARAIKENKDDEAKNTLAKANLGLVVKIAKIYENSKPDVTLLDIIRAGNLGLYNAAEKYDHEKDYMFSTYATWWIRQSIVSKLGIKDQE